MVKYCGNTVSNKKSINFTCISDDILYEDKDYSCGLKFLNLYEESNVCVLTKDEIVFFVDQIKELYKVDIDVFFHEKHKSRNKFSKYPFFVISYKSSDNLFIDKVVLTLLRYMFEEPYNLILKTVFLMADDDSFKDNDFWFNFETAIGCCYGDGGHGFISTYEIQPLKLYFKENVACRVNAMVNVS